MSKTKQVLHEMLTENTGTALCDSGGYPKYDSAGRYAGSSQGYGRNWERHAGLTLEDFEDMPDALLSFKYGIEVTLNLFHWLAERLEYNADMDAKFQRFSKDSDDSYLCDMEGFTGWLHTKRRDPMEVSEECTVNTYNGEDLLSQTIQYRYFVAEWQAYVLLQIPGGADVRGGYTRPRAFECDDYGLLDNADASIICSRDNHNWSTDDAYNWYWRGCCGTHYKSLQLNNMEIIKVDKLDQYADADGNLDFPVAGPDPRQLLLPGIPPATVPSLWYKPENYEAFLLNLYEAESCYRKVSWWCKAVAEIPDPVIQAEVDAHVAVTEGWRAWYLEQAGRIMENALTHIAGAVILVDSDSGNGYCPWCGGRLVAAA